MIDGVILKIIWLRVVVVGKILDGKIFWFNKVLINLFLFWLNLLIIVREKDFVLIFFKIVLINLIDLFRLSLLLNDFNLFKLFVKVIIICL